MNTRPETLTNSSILIGDVQMKNLVIKLNKSVMFPYSVFKSVINFDSLDDLNLGRLPVNGFVIKELLKHSHLQFSFLVWR